MKAGLNQTEVAEIVGTQKSTISRELKRNRGLCGYRSNQAHRLSVGLRQEKAKPSIDRSLVEHLL